MRVDLALRPEKPGLAVLAATNTGSIPLTVTGWPRLVFTTVTGQVAEVVVEQTPLPREPRPVELKPGQTAFAGVQLVLDDRAEVVAIGSIEARIGGALETEVNIISTVGDILTNTSRLKAREARIGTLQPTTDGLTTGL
ncbi:DUF4232 domain-containing protein [Lentzea sp. NPDC059081]|uniref:DUF4232 domain-containing protein n=1 Tax=Lentzea sp. NPDC059081 TaxID=3346719 RepID=UPI00367B8F3A